MEKNILVAAKFGNPSDRSNSDKNLRDALELTKLEPVRTLEAQHLTTAGRKRLEIARGLAASPKLLLLDEVMAGLAEDELGEVMDLVREIRNRGITIMATEHVMSSILRLADRLLVLNFGQLLFDGDPVTATKDPGVVDAYLGVSV